MTEFDAERDPLDLLADDFAQRYRRGEQPSVAEYAARYPEWAEQLRELLPPVARMEQWRRLRQLERGPAEGTPLRQLGDYRILRELGRGGMGIVYEAVQESLGRHVALKVLPRHSLLHAKTRERFRREAQAAAQLHHTNIVPVFGVGEQDGLPYYVMQLIPGQGLNELLADLRQAQRDTATDQETPSSALPDALPPRPAPARQLLPPAWHGCRWQAVAQVGIQVAEALDYAHHQGTLHRDIKPANLLLDQQGTVWVTDFGLAKGLPGLTTSSPEATPNEGLTDTGDIVGTLQYMAPENLHGRVSAQSDVYSLGLTLYELLTLESPFRGTTPAELLQEVREQVPPPPRSINPAIPRDLETIILRAIAREPEQRYRTAGDLAADLHRFCADRPIQARRATAVERVSLWCRRNRAIASLAAALVMVFLAGFAGVLWKWHEAWAEGQRAEANLRLAGEALRRESEQRAKAETATERAEANVSLSLQAFQDIFNQMSRREPPFTFTATMADGPPLPMAGPHKSEEDAALLASILSFYDRFAEQNETNPNLQLEAAKAYRRIRDIQERLGQGEKAAIVDRRALAILEKLAAEFPNVASYRFELAKTYALLPTRSKEPARLAEVEQRLQRAREIQEALAAAFAGVTKYTAALARTYDRLGELLRQQGQTEGAEAAYRQEVAQLRTLVEKSPTHPPYVLSLSMARQTLAELLVTCQQPAEARALLEESITDLKKLPQAGPRFRQVATVLVNHYRSLATTLTDLGESSLAEEASRKARETAATLPHPPGRPDAKHGPRPDGPRSAAASARFSSLAPPNSPRSCEPGSGEGRGGRERYAGRSLGLPGRGFGFANR